MAELNDRHDENTAALGEDIVILSVLESETFQKAPALRTLLKYLWDHRKEDLNEFRIAVDALGRRPDFNPKIDSTVRVQMLRVRQKLKEYYEKEGRQTRTRLILPSGSHRLQLETAAPDPSPQRAGPAWIPWMLAAVFAATTLIVLFADWRQPAQVSRGRAELAAFWQDFTKNGKPVRLIIPNVAFFRWPKNSIKIRDTRVNAFDEVSASPELREFAERWGRPELMINYTSAPDAYAATDLVAYLARRGIVVSVVGHRDAALDPADAYNRVLIGNPQSSPHILPLLAGGNFEPLRGFSFRLRNPNEGEPSVFPMVIESRRRETVPGLISRLQGAKTQRLILLSENTPALARLLTTPDGLAAMEKSVGKTALSTSFEVLSVAEVEAGRIVKIEPKISRQRPANH